MRTVASYLEGFLVKDGAAEGGWSPEEGQPS